MEIKESPDNKNATETYNIQQIHLTSLLEDLPPDDIIRIYKVKRCHCIHVNYVIILTDCSHMCTCMLLINSGLVCRYF